MNARSKPTRSNMNAHKYLKQLYDLNKRIKAQAMMLEEITTTVLSIAAPSFDKERVQSSGNGRDNALIKLMETEHKLNKNKIRYAMKQAKIINQIAELDGQYQEILTRRYVKFQEYQAIADEMGYSIQHIFRLRKEALQAFERRFPRC